MPSDKVKQRQAAILKAIGEATGRAVQRQLDAGHSIYTTLHGVWGHYSQKDFDDWDRKLREFAMMEEADVD